MSDLEIKSNGVQDTIDLGCKIAPLLEAGDVIVLCGDLGAGKTHLTKGIAAGLGITDEITSPTFNILRIHERGARLPLAHWDLYRLENMDQLEDVGYFEVIESGCVSVIEWGDKFPEAMPDEWVQIYIHIDDEDDLRTIEIDGHGQRGDELVAAMAQACK